MLLFEVLIEIDMDEVRRNQKILNAQANLNTDQTNHQPHKHFKYRPKTRSQTSQPHKTSVLYAREHSTPIIDANTNSISSHNESSSHKANIDEQ